MNSTKELLDMCEYTHNASSFQRIEEIKKNYSEFDKVVEALLDLKPYLKHSDFYLSLKDDYDFIELRNDLYNEDELLMLDGEITLWANEHNIEYLENSDNISILGFRHEEYEA